jgi:hypothetical protein
MSARTDTTSGQISRTNAAILSDNDVKAIIIADSRVHAHDPILPLG